MRKKTFSHVWQSLSLNSTSPSTHYYKEEKNTMSGNYKIIENCFKGALEKETIQE